MFKELSAKILILVVIYLTLTGCGDSTSSEEPSIIESNSPISQTNSPISSPAPSPIPPTTSTILEKVILDQPIKVGDTSVSGSGPANLPIMVYEVANTADNLGQLTIPENGKFVVSFEDRPLKLTERVGITLNRLELAKAGFEYEAFEEIAVQRVPVYGYILAEVSVQE